MRRGFQPPGWGPCFKGRLYGRDYGFCAGGCGVGVQRGRVGAGGWWVWGGSLRGEMRRFRTMAKCGVSALPHYY